MNKSEWDNMQTEQTQTCLGFWLEKRLNLPG